MYKREFIKILSSLKERVVHAKIRISIPQEKFGMKLANELINRDLFSKIKDYVVIGGLAVSKHIDPRYTADVDVLLTQSEFNKIKDMIENEHPAMFGISGEVKGIEYDFIFPSKKLYKDAINNFITVDGIKYINKMFLLLLKLDVSRDKDLSDILLLIKSFSPADLGKVKLLMKNYFQAEDIEDFESFVQMAGLTK